MTFEPYGHLFEEYSWKRIIINEWLITLHYTNPKLEISSAPNSEIGLNDILFNLSVQQWADFSLSTILQDLHSMPKEGGVWT